MASAAVLRRVEELLKRLRAGPRLLRVLVDEFDTVEALLDWAQLGGAVSEVDHTDRGYDVRVYLLPTEFDGHPLFSWRPVIRPSDATPEGIHLTVGA